MLWWRSRLVRVCIEVDQWFSGGSVYPTPLCISSSQRGCADVCWSVLDSIIDVRNGICHGVFFWFFFSELVKLLCVLFVVKDAVLAAPECDFESFFSLQHSLLWAILDIFLSFVQIISCVHLEDTALCGLVAFLVTGDGVAASFASVHTQVSFLSSLVFPFSAFLALVCLLSPVSFLSCLVFPFSAFLALACLLSPVYFLSSLVFPLSIFLALACSLSPVSFLSSLVFPFSAFLHLFVHFLQSLFSLLWWGGRGGGRGGGGGRGRGGGGGGGGERWVSCGRVGSSHMRNPAFGRGAEYRWSCFSGAVRSWSCAPDSQLVPPI